MPRYHVELTATKRLEVEVTDDDLGPSDESLTDVVAELAEADAFSNGALDFRVKVVEDWDLTIEEIKELVQ